jgi:hypothetical protein
MHVMDAMQTAQIEALAAYLTLDQIADYMSVDRSTMQLIKNRQPEVGQAFARGRAQSIGRSAQTIIQKAHAGDVVALKFHLATQGGWTETKALEMSTPRGPIEITAIEIVAHDPAGKDS